MNIDHIHFYVDNAQRSRNWCEEILGFTPVESRISPHSHTEILINGGITFVFSAPLTAASPVAQFLQFQPPGVADLAFRVNSLAEVLQQATLNGAKQLQPLQAHKQAGGELKWSQIQGWGTLKHTLVERTGITSVWPAEESGGDQGQEQCPGRAEHSHFSGIDHAVLNLADRDFAAAIAWYQQTLGFQTDRAFSIQTRRSGLRSQVLIHPQGTAQLPLNAPVSTGSQIQEFLELNRGAGIQHLALQTSDITTTIAQLRQRGLAFLETPDCYYSHLQDRIAKSNLNLEISPLKAQGILVDWQSEQPHSLLLQIFTQPIFNQPTFFLEIIERRQQAQGFGEGNFLALFEAIEREQMKRGSL
uniref:4-hydroxyphenylpyruvate dioxygenase n=1 Tax=Cyanothece sp. (strain PCC 7425 / ATCC 29141) TaxID=395961 RepID=B8HQB5_CYAP4